MPKDTFFSEKTNISCGERLVNLDECRVMGILNLSPDSFYDRGKHADNYLHRAEEMLSQGAAILDIGAQSTRPGAEVIDEKTETAMILPVIQSLKKHFPQCLISIDTFKSQTAREAVLAGADMVNDVSGGTLDKALFETVAELGVPYILTHIQGTPATMQQAPVYTDVVQDVSYYFSEKLRQLYSMGVKDVILDPGFGFGKTLTHNYSLLRHLQAFHLFELPILVGISRKSMIQKIIQKPAEETLNGSSILHSIALQNGAGILRVHDVAEAVEAVKLYNACKMAV